MVKAFVKLIRWLFVAFFSINAIAAIAMLLTAPELMTVSIVMLAVSLLMIYLFWPKSAKVAKAKALTYFDQIDEIIRSGSVGIQGIESPGFKLKRGEVCLFDHDSSLYLHKRTGVIGGHGITAKVKLAKGIYYRIGGGQIGAAKDWVLDDNGRLVITTNRLLFIGDLKTLSATHTTILDTQISNDGTEMLIKRDSGPDWRFAFGSPPDINRMAGAIAYLKGLVKEEVTT
jgi:hypothetical protein